MFIHELLNDGYVFVLTVRFQSDPIEFFTILSNERWKVLSQLERSNKHRADFILPLTNKEGDKLLEWGPTT